MTFELAGKITNRVCLAGTWRSIEEDALFRGHLELTETLTTSNKVDDVAVQQIERLSRKNHLFTFHTTQLVHFDAARLARIGLIIFQRQNFSAVAPCIENGRLQMS